MPAFAAAFLTIGYTPCASAEMEPDFEKVAFFARPDGTPEHAARQLDDGRWTSKLGLLQNIEHHTLGDLSDNTYGTVELLLRRFRARRGEARIRPLR